MERSYLEFIFGKSTTTTTVVDEAPGEKEVPYKQGRSKQYGEVWRPPYLNFCTNTRYIVLYMVQSLLRFASDTSMAIVASLV
jgi:hypothetical protein